MPSGVMDSIALTALSPLDGRYAAKAAPLREYLSEYALIRYRTLVEIRWLEHLADEPTVEGLSPLERPVKDVLNQLIDHFGPDDARRVKELERQTNHDVKAVEYYLRQKLEGVSSAASSSKLAAYLHFACTSEDINNLAYALMLRDALQRALLPRMRVLSSALAQLAHRYADLPMLARTHGQPATPTTLGKEIANFAARMQRQIDLANRVVILGKFNGAVGNYNAHVAAYPAADWPAITERFIESLGIVPTRFTTQIEPHDWIAELCQCIARFNTVLIDLCRDLWAYIGIGYFSQRPVVGEIGSSTMPHKINPIDFENAEGNLGLANALLEFLAAKLPISRWQRDLTDSTVLRNLAVALGHGLIAYDACQRGLDKLDADAERIRADLADSWEVLAEAIQTVMRRHGIADAYEQLKELTRGREITGSTLRAFVAGLSIPDEDKARLLGLTPSDYVGLAAKLAREI
jgi:adenylosuccinate lyase